LLDPKPGERILDLGCGDGALTAQIAAAGALVVGVDASAELLQAARARGLDVRQMDGQALGFDAEFDGLLTNAALHWMPDATAVIAGMARALKPGGRLVGEFGGHGNVAAIITALLASLRAEGIDGAMSHPWFFPTPAQYAGMLEEAGFTVDQIALIPRPTPLPTGIEGWLATFGNPFVEGLAQDVARRVLANAVALLEPSLRDHQGNWTADYVRIRFTAQKR
ncbi:MAG: methyltransferase domain-containing protein, partial [Rhodospirillales bacterium]